MLMSVQIAGGYGVEVDSVKTMKAPFFYRHVQKELQGSGFWHNGMQEPETILRPLEEVNGCSFFSFFAAYYAVVVALALQCDAFASQPVGMS